MDAEHRHELKENDLAEFLRNIGPFMEKWGNSILFAILIAMIVFFTAAYMRNRNATTHEQAWANLVLEQHPEALLDVAESSGVPAVTALAYLKAGTALLSHDPTQLTPATPATPDSSAAQTTDPQAAAGTSDPAKRTRDAQRAMDLFRSVLDLPEAPLIAKFNARLGLASASETLGEWDQARTIYTRLADDAKAAGFTTISANAEARMGMLDRLRQPMRFAPEPVAEVVAPADTDAGADAGVDAGVDAGAEPEQAIDTPAQ